MMNNCNGMDRKLDLRKEGERDTAKKARNALLENLYRDTRRIRFVPTCSDNEEILASKR